MLLDNYPAKTLHHKLIMKEQKSAMSLEEWFRRREEELALEWLDDAGILLPRKKSAPSATNSTKNSDEKAA